MQFNRFVVVLIIFLLHTGTLAFLHAYNRFQLAMPPYRNCHHPLGPNLDQLIRIRHGDIPNALKHREDNWPWTPQDCIRVAARSAIFEFFDCMYGSVYVGNELNVNLPNHLGARYHPITGCPIIDTIVGTFDRGGLDGPGYSCVYEIHSGVLTPGMCFQGYVPQDNVIPTVYNNISLYAMHVWECQPGLYDISCHFEFLICADPSCDTFASVDGLTSMTNYIFGSFSYDA